MTYSRHEYLKLNQDIRFLITCSFLSACYNQSRWWIFLWLCESRSWGAQIGTNIPIWYWKASPYFFCCCSCNTNPKWWTVALSNQRVRPSHRKVSRQWCRWSACKYNRECSENSAHSHRNICYLPKWKVMVIFFMSFVPFFGLFLDVCDYV